MITVSGVDFNQNDIWPSGSIESIIVQQIHEDPNVHQYRSIDELSFEVNLRKNIVDSSKALNQSQLEFEIFENARCNPQYWELTSTGGFKLKPDALPSEAIKDIYINSLEYATECATAILIIYYHAVLNSIDEDLFDHLFQDLYLYSWHYDTDLRLQSIQTDHLLPGDVVYFKNPDVSSRTPWLRGENAVVLEDGRFFGHGLGIRSSEQIIAILNKNREADSERSAFQENTVIRPSFRYLARLTQLPRRYKVQHTVIHHNQTSISCNQYLYYLNQLYSQKI
ncbi:protein-glutamine gamma-glutamyltransferase [Tenuibacillus multivorans]|uniref:Protein-glutamine gamma-glutamyltransferase n=1 Tax=Tenuibacillus multivorans TaxID=237069 RepID=A0A1H0ETQ8_9BACI|nr:protein-glutamine gamma-glutamyltransferase [Tenuibacillus multivorans]GEL76959.1 protein-glutamine gamma-glutamyltransferase [Tenuibacillus multivorans]SDN85706.1 protein-glutamine gamma-glutamyltransferase [Tenuibacillus multivorans]